MGYMYNTGSHELCFRHFSVNSIPVWTPSSNIFHHQNTQQYEYMILLEKKLKGNISSIYPYINYYDSNWKLCKNISLLFGFNKLCVLLSTSQYK